MPALPLKLLSIAPDLAPWDQGSAWSSCQNMRFRRQRAERIRGYDDTGITTPTSPGFLQNLYNISNNYWLISGFDKVVAWDGGATVNDVSPVGYATLTEVGQWTGSRGAFLQYLILNTVERSTPYVWDSASPAAVMTDYPAPAPNATCIRDLFNTFLFALDTADDSSANWDNTAQTVVWSDSSTGALPSWVPTTANRAGSTTLATSTPLIDVIGLRESAILFSSSDVFRVDFIGGQEVFDFTRIFSGDGILARNCCAEYEGVVYFLSTSGALLATDGTSVTTLADDKVNMKSLSELADDARGSWVAASPVSREIVFCPLTFNDPGPRSAYILDVDSGNIGQRTWPDSFPGGAPFGVAGVNSKSADDSWSATLPTDTWTDGRDIPWNFRESTPGAQLLFISTNAENLYAVDVNVTSNTGTLYREGIVPDPATDRVMLCRRLWIDGNIPADLNITVGGRYDDSSAYDTQLVSISPGTRSVPVSVKGRQFSLRLQHIGVAEWDISRINMEFGDSGGRY